MAPEKSQLAEIDRIGRQRRARERTTRGRRGGEIRRRLGDAQAAGDVEIDVVHAEPQAAMGFEHRQHHRKPVRIPADDGAPRRAERSGRNEGLDLDEHRPRALHAGKDGRSRRREIAAGQEKLGQGSGPPAAPDRTSRTRRSRRWGRSGSSRRAGCGNDGRCRPRRTRPRRPCARPPAGRRSARPW